MKLFAPFITVLLLFGCKTSLEKSSLPNVIIILADDLGYGDVGFNGQKKFSTPNIDSLAGQGLVFSQFYSGSTVCAPSRSTLLTGLHTGHTPIRGNREIQPEGQYPLPDSSKTIAEVFKSKGYVTGVFGKWGLGYPGSEGDPLNQGFDTFFGYNCQRLAHNYYPYHLWDNDKKILLEENSDEMEVTYAPSLIHQRTIDFIDQNQDNPFFLFVASPLPHAELKVPEQYLKKYSGQFEESPYQGCDPGCEQYKDGWYASQAQPHTAFAAMIHILDEQVGEIKQKLEEEGLMENTIIIFSSDNGPHKEGGADPDFFDSNDKFKGYKRDLYEGGIRVPTVISWKDKINSGISEEVGAFWDFMPTVAELIDYEMPIHTDGVSLIPAFSGNLLPMRDLLYWEFHTIYGVPAQALLMQERWKFVRKFNENMPPEFELYDLQNDPEEDNDLTSSRPELIDFARDTIDKMRVKSPIKEWNF